MGLAGSGGGWSGLGVFGGGMGWGRWCFVSGVSQVVKELGEVEEG